jgi:pimeloyl-ACP methyl ester carboxylesterase
MKYKPCVVTSLHGFKSHGKWQTKFADFMSTHKLVASSFNYGYKFWSALIPGFKKRLITDFYEQYCLMINNKAYRLDKKNPQKRPSIVAHSLGSYIVCNSLLTYPDIVFDKIILCGSIVSNDFNWDLIFKRNQVHFVRNEYSKKDTVVNWRWLLSWSNSGNTGKKGFQYSSNFFEEQEFEYFNHSNYFDGNHMSVFWVPFLLKPPPEFKLIEGKNISGISTFAKYFDQTKAIDDKCYGQDPHWADYAIPDNLAEEWIRINPDIYSFLSRTNGSDDILGYINAMPLKRDVFDNLLLGKVHDNEIRPSDILSYEEGNKNVDLYIMSIAISPQFQDTHLGLRDMGFDKLFNSLITKLIDYYKKNNVKVRRIAAIGWTPKGEKLCKLFGMTDTGHKEEETKKPIFLLTVDSRVEKNAHKSIRRLWETYQK